MKLTRSIKLPAKHPGIIFKNRILLAHNLSVTEAAKKMHINRSHLNNFSTGKVSVKAPLAMKLEKATGISAVFWMNLQKTYDLFIHSDLEVDCEPLYDLKMV
ncbi:HigA family addiction module antitoxin [Pseudocolwellia sp. AS88]|uniref:HigA family addiction module antitoxin n=1 Tax=Pseudocolwellia sp. AS88 TaxID=3063958 RepID=UPI0026F09A1B|nr:HigA family addiction module antitoxin [Pseudocolwellia sp. AS88]MDO7085560.1 HigA family addiction module antitoxin [Pseudocolwellia sp. AS88]